MRVVYTEGDTAPALTGTVNANLTGATAAVHVKRQDGSTFSRTATITDAVNGGWSATLQAGDLPLPGEYRVELLVTFSSGGKQTFARSAADTAVSFWVREAYV